MFEILSNYIKLMVFSTRFCDDDIEEFKEYEATPTFKHVRSSNWCSDPYLTMCFWASLLLISFEDLNLVIYIWVFNAIKEVIMNKKFNLTNNLLLLLGLWQKKTWFKYTIAVIWSTLPCSHQRGSVSQKRHCFAKSKKYWRI